jgi:hypothetical protein
MGKTNANFILFSLKLYFGLQVANLAKSALADSRYSGEESLKRNIL